MTTSQTPARPMEIESEPSFRKRLQKKPREMQEAIIRCCQQLADDPTHPGLQSHRMQGHPGVWEAYVDAGNRVTFHFADGRLVMRNNCNHDSLRRRP